MNKTLIFLLVSLWFSDLFSQECGIIYVTPNGANSGQAGTKANPANLTYGLSLVNAQNTRLWLAAGTYHLSQPLQIVNNLTIEGGFNPTTWVKSNNTPTILQRDAGNVIPMPANALVGIAGINVANFRLQDLTLEVAPATTPQTSVYGIYLNGCSNYSIVRCQVTTGAAGAGVNGTPGAPGQPGGNGGNGVPAGNEHTMPNHGGAGGIGANHGGNGGTMGRWAGYAPSNGQPGGGPCGGSVGNGGSGGTGPNCGCGLFGNSTNNSCGGSAPTPGGNGGDGLPGADGANGLPGSVVGGYFVPGPAGANGSNGGPGCGGGGGGGGGGRQQPGADDTGGSGGGGGGGGYGGSGGTGGTGGGSSFAIFTFNNGANGLIKDCRLQPGAAGLGGIGGNGGLGGAGGVGGNGGSGFGCPNSVGARGGNGGNGGPGGKGGDGAPGWSIALSEHGGIPVIQQNITSIPGNPPIISVENPGCVNAEVTFTSPVAGNWNFGSASTPNSASGSGPHKVIYHAVGRKTIQFNGVDFADFVDIFNNSLLLPSISSKNSNHFTGCPDSFTTTLSGTWYEWDFGPNSLPQTLSGNQAATAGTVFLTPGQRVIKVWVTTACCGRVYDSLVINVQQSLLNVSVQASKNPICAGENVSFTASPNTYVNYRFFLNGIEVQNSSSAVYSHASLQNNDSVYVIAFDGSCFTNVSNTVVMTVYPIPTVTLSSSDADNTICAGESVTFTALPSGSNQYEFRNNGVVVQSSSSNIFTTSALSNPNSVSVVAIHHGCRSAPSHSIATIVNSLPSITLTSSDANDSICAGDNITFTASPTGLANYEFFVNGISVQNGPSNTFTSGSLPNGANVYAIPTANGCTGSSSNVISTAVIPIPSATLSVNDQEVCAGETVVFTASPSGLSQYNFLNNGTSVQNSSSAVYSTRALTPGNHVSVVPVLHGCVGSASNAISVIIHPSPSVDAGNDFTVCADQADVTLSGFLPVDATWSGPGITQANGIFSPAAAGVGTVSLVLSYTANGCTGRDTLSVTVHALPIAFAGNDTSVCEGNSITLRASGGVNFSWQPAGTLSAPNAPVTQATPLTTTTYTVTVTDANQCTATDDVVITVNPKPIAAFEVSENCATQPISITNYSTPAGSAYVWNFGDGHQAVEFEPTHSFGSSGTYQVLLVATLGNCTDSATQSVFIPAFPQANFSAAPLQAVQGEDAIVFENLSAHADNFTWQFGNGNSSEAFSPVYIYPDTGWYTVTLIATAHGCADTLVRERYVRIVEKSTLYIPNLFSPNGDGSNDLFKVIANGVARFDLKIFNRWGEMVFHTYDVEQAWDGYYRGALCEPGIYTYSLKVLMMSGENLKRKGSIILLR